MSLSMPRVSPRALASLLASVLLSSTLSAAATEVVITDEGYSPQVLKIPVHTTVTWRNVEGVHTTTSADGLWDSGVLVVGATFSYAFDEVGLYDYGDTIHDWPSGTIEVVHSLAEIGVTTDASLYAAGDVLQVGADLANPGDAVLVGIRIWGTTPIGVELTLLEIPNLLLPAGFAFADTAWMSFALPALPRGDYAVHARLTKMPEGDLLGLSSAPWTFGEVRQSDWSGGPGASAPTPVWQQGFEQSAGASWRSIPGQLSLSGQTVPSPTADVVALDAGRPNSVATGDLDGDGRDDLITTDPVYDIFLDLGAVYRWTLATDGTWTKHTVSDDFYGATYVRTADVDQDGDLDVPAAAYYGDGPELGRNGKFAWFENDDGVAGAWTKHVVGDLFWGASYVDAGDIDGDGDVDLIGASQLTDGIWEQESDMTWFENLDAVGDAWGQHDLDLFFHNAGEAHLADLDADGDLDVVGAWSHPTSTSSFAWWENDVGDGSAWTKRFIPFEFWGQGYVNTGDVDLDGDVDLVGGGYNSSPVGFWENLDGAGTSWISWQISALAAGRGVELEDIDGDGDLDALLWNLTWMHWLENLDGVGFSWGARFLHTGLGHPWGAVGDVDDDGKLEVAVTSEDFSSGEAAQVLRYDTSSFGPAGDLDSAILDGGTSPDWRTIDWDAKVPRNTTLGVEVRAGNDPLALGPFASVPAPGFDLGGVIDEDARYLQVRLRLTSTDPEASPVLRELKVSRGEGW